MVEPEQEELPRMSLLEHLEELRTRIIRSFLAVTIAFFGCWAFAEEIFGFLARPIYRYLPEGSRLTFLGVTDPFILYVKVAALAAVFLASPIVLYEVWRFVAPGLYGREKRYSIPFVMVGTVLFLGGGAFAYLVAFPFAIEFLLGMGTEFEAMITIERYFGFLLTVILGLGVMFEVPMLIFVLARIGVVTPAFLMRHFRWAVLLIFIAAAILTPTPDIVNLCIFALPTIGLYLLGVFAAWIVERRESE